MTRQYPRNPVSPGEELRQWADRLKGNRPPLQALLVLLLVLLLAVGLYSAFYKVDTEETGVLLRLGRFVGFVDPGLHMKLPFGIDQVRAVQTGRVLKEEFGFRTVDSRASRNNRTVYTKRGLENESLTLTGDLNVTDVEWIVQYQVSDPFKYLYRIHEPGDTIRDISEAMVRKVIGNANVAEVLTTERALLAATIQKDLQATLNSYDIGVRIVTVKFQGVLPPGPVKAAFNEVNEAEQQKESLIFQAREQYNREVPKARGVAKRTIQEAEGYAIERINQARGETARFVELLGEYRKSPQVTRQRLYLETLEQVLPKMKEIYIMDPDASGPLPLLNLRDTSKGGKP
jgi:membrane protease subunit HflK